MRLGKFDFYFSRPNVPKTESSFRAESRADGILFPTVAFKCMRQSIWNFHGFKNDNLEIRTNTMMLRIDDSNKDMNVRIFKSSQYRGK